MQNLWNKKTLTHPYWSIAEEFEEWIKKVRMPEHKIKRMVKKFSKNLNCD
jgi:hypothetical protein